MPSYELVIKYRYKFEAIDDAAAREQVASGRIPSLGEEKRVLHRVNNKSGRNLLIREEKSSGKY